MDDLDNVKTHIDAPIRKAVAGMNLFGFTTLMSCCGFTYDDEEVEKSHLGKCYMYLDSEKTRSSERLMALLTALSLHSRWVFKDNGPFIDFYGETWRDKGSGDHPWAKELSVHNYEVFLLSIFSLNQAIEKHRGFFLDEARIKDGNSFYANISSFWKFKPKNEWVITKGDWDKIPF